MDGGWENNYHGMLASVNDTREFEKSAMNQFKLCSLFGCKIIVSQKSVAINARDASYLYLEASH